MALEPNKFKGTHETIQVGGLNTTLSETVAADVSTTAQAADHIVSVKAHEDVWFLIGDDGDALAPAVDTGIPVFAYSETLPFHLKAGKVIEATGKITLQFHDVED
jgi:hypothetical protein